MLKYLKKTYLGVLLVFLYAPIAVLIIFSFNSSKTQAHWSGFTLNWYVQLFQDNELIQALINTLIIAVLSTVIATVLGTAAAIGINDMGKKSRKVMTNLLNIPVLSPDIVTGISLMLLFSSFINILHFGNFGLFSMLLAHITFNTPYVILSVTPKLRQLDNNLYEAALDLGAGPFFAFRKVIFPEITPGIITGALLAFTMSIDDFIISYFTCGSNVSNLSIYVFSSTKRGISPKINALSAIMFTAVIVLLYIVNKRSSVKNKQTESAMSAA